MIETISSFVLPSRQILTDAQNSYQESLMPFRARTLARNGTYLEISMRDHRAEMLTSWQANMLIRLAILEMYNRFQLLSGLPRAYNIWDNIINIFYMPVLYFTLAYARANTAHIRPKSDERLILVWLAFYREYRLIFIEACLCARDESQQSQYIYISASLSGVLISPALPHVEGNSFSARDREYIFITFYFRSRYGSLVVVPAAFISSSLSTRAT